MILLSYGSCGCGKDTTGKSGCQLEQIRVSIFSLSQNFESGQILGEQGQVSCSSDVLFRYALQMEKGNQG